MKKQQLIITTVLTTIASLFALPNFAYGHQIIESTGSVEIKKSNWSDYRVMGVGTTLHSGDMLQPIDGANIYVLCDDFSIWNVPSNGISDIASGCDDLDNITPTTLQYHRGENDISLPYIMMPRHTLLMDNEFTISWNRVEDATSYLVTIQGEDGLNWTQEVNDTQIIYNGEQKFETNFYYIVTVESDNGFSSLDTQRPQFGFGVISENQAETLQDIIDNINTSNLSSDSKAIALGILYNQGYLYYDGISSLEALVTSGTQNPLVYQILGDMYVQIGLNILAQERYHQAIELADNDKDLEVLSNTQAGLAGLNIILGNNFQAGKLAQQAQDGYEFLGYSATELEENLISLIEDNNSSSFTVRSSRRTSDIFQNVIMPQQFRRPKCFPHDIPGITC